MGCSPYQCALRIKHTCSLSHRLMPKAGDFTRVFETSIRSRREHQLNVGKKNEAALRLEKCQGSNCHMKVLVRSWLKCSVNVGLCKFFFFWLCFSKGCGNHAGMFRMGLQVPPRGVNHFVRLREYKCWGQGDYVWGTLLLT